MSIFIRSLVPHLFPHSSPKDSRRTRKHITLAKESMSARSLSQDSVESSSSSVPSIMAKGCILPPRTDDMASASDSSSKGAAPTPLVLSETWSRVEHHKEESRRQAGVTKEEFRAELDRRDEELKVELDRRDEKLKVELDRRDEKLKVELDRRDEKLKVELGRRDEKLKVELGRRDEKLKVELGRRDEKLKAELTAEFDRQLTTQMGPLTDLINKLLLHTIKA